MQIIPLNAVASQTLTANLNNQVCQINVYQKQFYTDNNEQCTPQLVTPVFLDLAVNNAPIISGVICLHANKIVRDAYLGFIGDLAFYDLQGSTDPIYTGFGTRYVLVYLAPGDV